MSGESALRCAYIVSRYPSVTHTFVLQEVLALRARGVDVGTVTVRRSEDYDVISEADRAEAERTHAVLPTTPAQVIRAHLNAFRRSPAAYLRTLLETLRDAPAEPRTIAWQFFYFVEGILLWDWLESQDRHHIHAHHANVGADLAMIATRFANRCRPQGRFTWSLTIHGPTELAEVSSHKLPTKLTRADAVVATSDFVRAQLLSLVDPKNHVKIRTVYCGVTPTTASADRSDRNGRPLRLLSVARLSRRKGESILLDALARLHDDGHDFELTIVGDGPERELVERRADDLGIAGSVNFAGALGRDEVPRYYREADIFCLPSFAEGVPTVLMEAMDNGLPVIATAVMGVPELVSDGCGILVPPARADRIADALAQLDEDPAMRTKLGEAGRRKVHSEFTLERSADQLESLFREVMSDAG